MTSRPAPRNASLPRPGPVAVLMSSYVAGAVPFSYLAARRLKGVDLRRVGGGTVSGTGLYQVAGFGPLALAGCLEVAKGALGPWLAGRDRPFLAAVAGGAAVSGHNWSPFLRFAGGRGMATGIGAALAVAPEGAVLLTAGMTAGRLAGETAIGCLGAIVSLPVYLAWRRGRPGLASGLALSVPMVAKRIIGNGPAEGPGKPAVYAWRLLLDRDSRVLAEGRR